MLEQVRDLGVTHHVAKLLGGVAQAYVLDNVGQQVIDARGALDIVAGHERGAFGQADACGERAGADLDALDVDECHAFSCRIWSVLVLRLL